MCIRDRGISEEAVRVGADVFKMYEVVDVIAHEYSEGEYYASDRAAYDWYNYIIGMQTFKAFAEDKASWMLSYSWLDNKKVAPSDAMKSLFVSQIFSGTNMWDVEGYVMSSTCLLYTSYPYALKIIKLKLLLFPYSEDFLIHLRGFLNP